MMTYDSGSFTVTNAPNYPKMLITEKSAHKIHGNFLNYLHNSSVNLILKKRVLLKYLWK